MEAKTAHNDLFLFFVAFCDNILRNLENYLNSSLNFPV